MPEIKVTKYQCAVCGRVFDTDRECQRCEEIHAQREQLTEVGRVVVVNIGGPGAPSMMGGAPSGRDNRWVKGKIIAKRAGRDGPRALVELPDGAREWRSAWELEQDAKEEAASRQPPPPPFRGSCCTIMIGGFGRE